VADCISGERLRVTVRSPHHYFLAGAQYGPTGALVSGSFGWYFGPNGASHVGSFTNILNDRLRISSQATALDNGTRLLDLTYQYPAGADNGNVSQITNGRDESRTQHFDYDTLNRLAHAYSSGPLWGETFTYDAWGNLSKSSYPLKTNYESTNGGGGGADRYNRAIGLAYDLAGNVTNDGQHAYTYDAEGRILTVDGGTVAYAYDGDGRRIKKCSANCTSGTLYWFAAGEVLAESDLSGIWKASYVHLSGRSSREVTGPSAGPFARVDYPT
jgi:YD repeat-containing protein